MASDKMYLTRSGSRICLVQAQFLNVVYNGLFVAFWWFLKVKLYTYVYEGQNCRENIRMKYSKTYGELPAFLFGEAQIYGLLKIVVVIYMAVL